MNKTGSSLQSSSVRPPVLSWCQESGSEQRFHPLSFILHPCSSVSAQKFVNVRVFGFAQGFVGAAEDDLAIAHHQDLAVDETKLFPFFFKHDLAGFVSTVFRRQVFEDCSFHASAKMRHLPNRAVSWPVRKSCARLADRIHRRRPSNITIFGSLTSARAMPARRRMPRMVRPHLSIASSRFTNGACGELRPDCPSGYTLFVKFEGDVSQTE